VLARIRKAREEREEGFTLIELLVVMIIIGILAAIAIPVFLSQRSKAQDSAAKADVSTIGKELASYYVDGTALPAIAIAGGRYTLTPAGGTAQDIGATSANSTVDSSTNIVDSDHWCVAVTNAKGSVKTWKYSERSGLGQGACTATDVS
jgi:prepilin-type N-terminal cleavage/methylation domain-containing protein